MSKKDKSASSNLNQDDLSGALGQLQKPEIRALIAHLGVHFSQDPEPEVPPTPQELQELAAIDPSFADRRMVEWEKSRDAQRRSDQIAQELALGRLKLSQAEQQIAHESKQKAHQESSRGQWFGLVATGIVVAAAAYIAGLGGLTQAAVVICVGIAFPVAVFVLRTMPSSSQLKALWPLSGREKLEEKQK